MKKFYPFHLRQVAAPTVDLPVACRSVGHFRTFPGWHNPPKVRPFVQVFWGIRGTGVFRPAGRDLVLRPGEVLALYGGARHDFTAQSAWEFRWLTLDGRLSDAVVRAFGYGDEPHAAGPCPEELFERLTHEIEDVSPQGQRAASATAYEILSMAFDRMRPGERAADRVRECVDLVRRHYADPNVNVAWLACRLGMHRSTLSRLFRARMKLTPIQYLAACRVTRALVLLRGTDRPLARIARETGFSHPAYFAHVIRKQTGHAPRELRG